MADDDEGVGPSSSNSSNISEAEKRRLRRRQRILDNQGTRLQKILGSDGIQTQGSSLTTDAKIVQDDLTASPIEIFRKSLDSERTSSESGTSSRTSTFSTVVHSHTNNEEFDQVGRRSSNITTLLQELSNQNVSEERNQETTATAADEGTRIGVQDDGSVVLPRIGTYYGRILLCVLAIFLSLFKAKQYMVTFLSWEIAFYWLNGLPPMPPLNMAMVLVAVMGLKETQLNKIKKVVHICDCISIDMSLYLFMVLLPHIISSFARDLR